MSAPQRLAQYVKPNLPEARVAHQWAKLVNSQRSASHFRPRAVRTFAFAIAFVAVVAFGAQWYRTARATRWDGAVVDTGPAGAQSVTLADGSRIELAPASRLVIDECSPSQVQLSLRHGKAEFQVTHRDGRSFRVLAGAYEISVVGTKFSVALKPNPPADEPQVSVQVEQGKVKVRNQSTPHEERVLTSGESWIGGTRGSSTEASARPEAAGDQTQENASEAAPSAAADEGDVALANPGSTASAAANVVPGPLRVGPRELLEKAELLRISGKSRESAEVLDKLRRTFRTDRRAGLAAFELGRIRMDVFGDLAGSLEALNDAIQLSPGASFREDAQSRLVQIFYRQGNLDRCRNAKLDYLKHFPNGAASKVVSRLCEP